MREITLDFLSNLLKTVVKILSRLCLNFLLLYIVIERYHTFSPDFDILIHLVRNYLALKMSLFALVSLSFFCSDLFISCVFICIGSTRDMMSVFIPCHVSGYYTSCLDLFSVVLRGLSSTRGLRSVVSSLLWLRWFIICHYSSSGCSITDEGWYRRRSLYICAAGHTIG